MPRLILHIGTHKTATTSIQKFLRHNAQELADRGVFYPDYSIVNKNPHYAHLGMVNALSGRHKNYPRELAEKFFAKVLERSPDYDTTIISAEPFYRHVENDPKDDPFYTPDKYWPLRSAYINKMRGMFGDADVVVVFRRQAEYAQSLYQEHVKVTRYTGSFQQFQREFWFHFAFAEQASAWRKAFPKTSAISFDLLQQTENAITEFCKLLHLPIEGLEMPPRANEGMLTDLVILKRMLHRTKVDKDTLRKRLEILSDKLSEDTLSFMRNRSFFSSLKETMSFQKQFEESNELLRPLMLHSLEADSPMFRTDFDENQNFGDRLKPPFLLEMLELSLSGAKPDPISAIADKDIG